MCRSFDIVPELEGTGGPMTFRASFAGESDPRTVHRQLLDRAIAVLLSVPAQFLDT